MRRHVGKFSLLAALLAAGPLVPSRVPAAPPPGYYDTVDASSPAALRATLHAVIDDHTRFPYSASTTDTWNILELADENPANAANILDLYRNRSYAKFGGGTGPYNREHTWPNSYGFPNDGTTNYPYTDCHHLFLCDVGYNGDRGNLPFGNAASGASERATDFNDGQGGGSGVFPGNSNWFNTSVWQTWVGRKGDVARAIFYMDVRYEGGTHGITGAAEPNLIVTDNAALIVTTGSNASVAYMGLLSVLVQWNAQDPVDNRERAHNDAVYGFQGNRNPFVDHPEWVNALFVSSTGPTITSIQDVPMDQGGALQVQWARCSLDVAGSIAPIAQYTVQRFAAGWVDVAVQPANASATYTLVVPTSDIASPATPAPQSDYRVAAIETGGTIRLSGVVGAYSVDNVAPPAPVLTINANSVPWILAWEVPPIADFDVACLYRGDASGFTPTVPLTCTADTTYLEFDTNPHWYVLQFSDIHGNWGDFSAEVASTPTDAPVLAPLRTAITRIQPNPFNPTTHVSFSIAAAGPVRIAIFTADGRLVRTLLDDRRPAGAFFVPWDGTDSQGSPAPSGTYLFQLQSGGHSQTRKATLLK